MCGNCCVFPESFFQRNTIQACGKQGVTAEMDWHPEARTNSDSVHPLTHSIKRMSDTPQDARASGAQSPRALGHQQHTWILCPAFPSTRGRAGHGLWQPGAPCKGAAGWGWSVWPRVLIPAAAGGDNPAIHCHPLCTPCPQLLGVEGCCLWGECTLAGGDMPQRNCPEATRSLLFWACVP